jgi:hypothetical protein
MEPGDNFKLITGSAANDKSVVAGKQLTKTHANTQLAAFVNERCNTHWSTTLGSEVLVEKNLSTKSCFSPIVCASRRLESKSHFWGWIWSLIHQKTPNLDRIGYQFVQFQIWWPNL